MRAATGAIEVVRLSQDELELGVIGDVDPTGLCGSGLVDAVAELVELGLLDSTGRFVPDEDAARIAPGLCERLTKLGKERVSSFIGWASRARSPSPSTSHSAYVRELQFAKAAIATGWRILLEEAGIEVAQLQQVLLAGSFGSYLRLPARSGWDSSPNCPCSGS